MRDLFGHKAHLFRMALLFAGGTLLFLILRALLVPPDFGVHGHYRAGALDDNREPPIRYAGRAACTPCHTDVVEARQGSRHEGIGCEACHGALAAHAAGEAESPPVRPDPRAACLLCHEANVARPAGFPQVQSAGHSPEGPCTDCHLAHAPGLS